MKLLFTGLLFVASLPIYNSAISADAGVGVVKDEKKKTPEVAVPAPSNAARSIKRDAIPYNPPEEEEVDNEEEKYNPARDEEIARRRREASKD